MRRVQLRVDAGDAGKRLDQLVAARLPDLSLYNEAKIKEGIENDTFFTVLAEEIEEGRAHYQSRVDPRLYASTNFFERALIDVILARKGHIKSKIW